MGKPRVWMFCGLTAGMVLEHDATFYRAFGALVIHLGWRGSYSTNAFVIISGSVDIIWQLLNVTIHGRFSNYFPIKLRLQKSTGSKIQVCGSLPPELKSLLRL